MNALWNFVVIQHPAASAAFGTWLLGNICASLPSPSPSSGQFYRFLFSFASVIGASLPRTVPNLRIGQSNPTAVTVPGSPANEPTNKQ